MRRLFLAAVLVLASMPAMVTADPSLVGTWSGSMEGRRGSEARTLIIKSVSPDGQVVGGWGLNENPKIGNAQIELKGGTLFIKTGAGGDVELTKSGANTLVGKYTSGSAGRGSGTREVKLTRQ
jgi:hypothetical protein